MRCVEDHCVGDFHSIMYPGSPFPQNRWETMVPAHRFWGFGHPLWGKSLQSFVRLEPPLRSVVCCVQAAAFCVQAPAFSCVLRSGAWVLCSMTNCVFIMFNKT